MRRANLIAFDDYVMDATPQYSTTELNNALGEFGAWNLQAVVDDPRNVDSITLQLETSADGRNWAPKNAQPEVSGTVGGGTTTVLQGRDPGTIGAGMALVRLKLSLFGALAAPSAHVKVWIRGGDQADSFVPPHLSGCALWLRADMGIILSSGANVSTWADQSGSGNTATAGGTAVPTSGVDGNGLARVTVAAGSGGYMTGNFAASVTAYTLFAVVSYPVLSNTAAFAGTNASFNVNSGFAQFNEAPTGIIARTGSAAGAFVSAVSGATSSLNKRGMYSTSAADNTAVDLFINGVAAASTPASFTLVSCSKYVLFGLGVPIAYNLIGDAYEYVLYNRALAASERVLVHRYLGGRYQIAVP